MEIETKGEYLGFDVTKRSYEVNRLTATDAEKIERALNALREVEWHPFKGTEGRGDSFCLMCGSYNDGVSHPEGCEIAAVIVFLLKLSERDPRPFGSGEWDTRFVYGENG